MAVSPPPLLPEFPPTAEGSFAFPPRFGAQAADRFHGHSAGGPGQLFRAGGPGSIPVGDARTVSPAGGDDGPKQASQTRGPGGGPGPGSPASGRAVAED